MKSVRYLMATHDFFDCFTNITQTNIDARLSDTRICGLSNCLNQRIELRVEIHRERTINYTSIYMNSVVNLAHVTILKKKITIKSKTIKRFALKSLLMTHFPNDQEIQIKKLAYKSPRQNSKRREKKIME